MAETTGLMEEKREEGRKERREKKGQRPGYDLQR
jgi:hypothetical protein